MRHIVLLLLIIPIISFSSYAWAASCERCYEKIADDGKKLCEACTLSTSRNLSEMKSREQQIINDIISTRQSYKNALKELIQFYLDIGYQLRMQKARKELNALNKVPLLNYLSAKETITNISPTKDIEEANILFQDGKNYVNILNLTSRKSKSAYAASRFKKILDDYPESDKTDDAAYELARIYEGRHFRDYEGAAFYYVKSYELNPHTDKPARFKAARVYDNYLSDYAEAARHYEMALETCKETEYLKIAKPRLEELRKQGY